MEFAALATFSHYQDHLWPIIDELRTRGHTVHSFTTWQNGGFAEYRHPSQLTDIHPVVWLTASAMDAQRVEPAMTVYVEHGAGQSYDADMRSVKHSSYSNGVIVNAALFLCPNLFTLARRMRNCDVPAAAVGSPRLDQYPIGNHEGVERAVAFAWHWSCELVPETQSAFDHYLQDLQHIAIELRRNGYTPVAHAHPRIARRVRWHLERKGFEWWDIDDVMNKAAVLCADNTSVMYEFAHVDRPIVVLNAPWYRRHVHHGLRFWECIPGEQVDEPEEVVPAIRQALSNDPWAAERSKVRDLVFPLQDGHATGRACDLIEVQAARM